MKKYLLVVTYCEEETYLYDSLEELLADNEVSSLEELLKKNSWFEYYTVYEISDIFKGD